MQKVICIDDFGNEVYKCHWTGILVSTADSVITGGFIPGVKGAYVAVKDHIDAMRESRSAYDEMESNCNTCKNLERVKSNLRGGFLNGKCLSSPSFENMQYPTINGVMMFHPHDPMHMPCWEPRK